MTGRDKTTRFVLLACALLLPLTVILCLVLLLAKLCDALYAGWEEVVELLKPRAKPTRSTPTFSGRGDEQDPPSP